MIDCQGRNIKNINTKKKNNKYCQQSKNTKPGNHVKI